MAAVIVIGSWDSAAWAEPRRLDVSRVVRGADRRRRQYAIASVTYETGVTEWVAVTLRSSLRWRPQRGREAEALAWTLTGPDDLVVGGRFVEPDSGVAITYVLEGDVEEQMRKYRAQVDFGRGGRSDD